MELSPDAVGGIMTAASVPLIVAFGPIPMLIVTSVIAVGWLLLGLFYFGKKKASN